MKSWGRKVLSYGGVNRIGGGSERNSGGGSKGAGDEEKNNLK